MRNERKQLRDMKRGIQENFYMQTLIILAKTLIDNRKQLYLLGLIDDCTRLCHVELIERNSCS